MFSFFEILEYPNQINFEELNRDLEFDLVKCKLIDR